MSKNTDIKNKEGSALQDAAVDGDLIEDASEKNLEIAIKKGFRTPAIKVTVRLALAVLLVVSIVVFVTGLMKYSELQKEKEALELRLEEYENNIEELEYLLDSPVDYDYIVRMAREKLGLHLPDEIIYYNDTK
ncbi:MAG: septum formation initiator family protein [Ruminococcaceae bacterium]|nr:septum formation initiator family protein [Oscillospiraceae bacterium]